MNYMKEVAHVLGVKPYEEFNLSTFGSRKFRFTEQGFEYFHEPIEKWVPSGLLYRILEGVYEIVKIPEPILDEPEKEYLSNIIKPWRKDVLSIIKVNYNDNKQYISINLENDVVSLPAFKKDTMYKGMSAWKSYTPDELGL